MTTALLRTKLYIPRPSRTVVVRQTLIERLNEGIDRDLTLVVAPVGYGKTTLLAMWVAQTTAPVCWLTLNEQDSDLGVFVGYLLAAIQTRFPSACLQTQSLLESGRTPEIDRLATLLINEIDDLPQRFVLVLDDYHLIQAAPVHQLLDSILRHPPLQMHLLIASRADPPLALARLRAAQRLHELRVGDLRFSPAEAATFLTQALAQSDQTGAVQLLAQRTEGWIAGMQLAVLSLRTVSDQAAMLQHLAQGSHRYIMDYLLEQVLNQQSPLVQEFLLKTSILEQMSPPLVQAVVGDEDAQSNGQISLRALERAGSFVSALDGGGEWYTYHALFRELLRHHLQQRYSVDVINDLHRRASIWFRDAEWIDMALYHALAAGDVDLAAQIIVDHFATWLDREHWPAIERWLNLLPAAAFTKHPWLLVARANIAQLRSDYGAVLPLLEDAEARLAVTPGTVTSQGEVVLRGYLDLLWATHWLFGDQPHKAAAAAKHAWQSLPPAHRYMRGTALQVLTVAMQIAGNVAAAIQLVEDELARTPRASGGAYSRLRLLLSLMSLHVADGYIEPGKAVANLLLEEATAANAPISQLWAQLALGAIAYEANDLPEAMKHFMQGMELRTAGHMRGGHECMTGLALTYQALGRTDEAHSVVSMLHETHRQSGNMVLAAEAQMLQLHLDVLAGGQFTDHPWRPLRASAPAILFGWRVVPAVTQVHLLLAEASSAALHKASAMLDELLEIATTLHKPARSAEYLALQARCFAQQDAYDKAVVTLTAAVAIAAPRGLVRSLADAGPALTPVVTALAHAAPSPYLTRLLHALRAPTAASAAASAAPDRAHATVRLTRRERDVLRLLHAYKTDREIAEELVISPLTVRTHIEHLSEKLGVNGRRAIVARAVSLNLLA
ncbi:MAG: LuxR C-terminal-related transcriptional regulator [Caldilinea sp.]